MERTDEPRENRRAAADALREIGLAGIPALGRALMNDWWEVSEAAGEALAKMGSPAVKTLVKVLAQAKDEKPRLDAAQALARLGIKARPAIPQLIRSLSSDKDAGVRIASAEALGAIGPAAAPAIPALAQVVRQGKDSTVQIECLRTLGKIGPRGLPHLVKALSIVGDRMFVALAMGKVGEPAIPVLSRLLREDEDVTVRQSAAEALGQIGPGAIPALTRALLGDRHNFVRADAAKALGTMGPRAAEAVPALVKAIQSDEDRSARYQVVIALRKIGPAAKSGIGVLEKLLFDKKAGLQTEAAKALGAIGNVGPEAISALERLAEKDPESWVREAARNALRKLRK
jgi:HEAT repeat protein